MNGTSDTSFLKLTVISPNIRSIVGNEKKYARSMTIQEMKSRLTILTAIDITTMKVEVHNEHGSVVCNLDNEEATLGSYPVENGMILHVTGQTSSEMDFEAVPKFEISEDDYTKRGDSARSFLQKHKFGKFSDTSQKAAEIKVDSDLKFYDELKTKLGCRCEVSPHNKPAKRGKLVYVGDVHFKTGIWCGIQYDEPLGKNDGSVDGRRYFQCPPSYGGFIQPKFVSVGDYPEKGLPSDDEM